MIKKITIAAVALALSLSFAVPAFAKTVVINKDNKVKTNVTTVADTGSTTLKIKKAGVDGSATIDTGNARAKSLVTNKVNKTNLDCGCDEDGKIVVVNKDNKVKTNVTTVADTGSNTLSIKKAGVDGDASIDTGNAKAKSVVVNVVNSTVIGD